MKKPKKANGRPLTAIDWAIFDALCEVQCTLAELASHFQCSEDTIERAVIREQGVGFAEYIKSRAGKGKVSLRRSQFQLALTGNPTMLIWLGKQYLEQSDKTDVKHSGTVKTWDLTKLSDDELARLEELETRATVA